METVFLETVSTPVFPDPPIDISKFQVHEIFRFDTIVLRDSDRNERYRLVVVDRRYNDATDIQEPPCVWLHPPTNEPKSDRRRELQRAAKRMGCVRMIAVDQRPPGVGDDIVVRELHHIVRVLAQTSFFLGPRLDWRRDSKEVHFVFNETGR